MRNQELLLSLHAIDDAAIEEFEDFGGAGGDFGVVGGDDHG